jgi:N-acetylglucosamine kinase-like BadF-type ATPase
MILVADSGSTKCDWVIISTENEQIDTKTMGFNPFFHSSDFIIDQLSGNETLKKFRNQIDQVYFYGAGCSSDQRNGVINEALNAFFPNLKVCRVDHDLLAACIATASDEQAIACILGTGSNSCYYDGQRVVENVPALGYVLGDEGSGSYFGKTMLRDWIYKTMPSDLHEAFGARYELDKEQVFSAVYTEENPNVYLAGFMPFASQNKEHPYIKALIYKGLSEFAKFHICCYSQYRELPVHFVGSIAYYFKDVLDQVAKDNGFSVGLIRKKPVIHMAEYHRTHAYMKG